MFDTVLVANRGEIALRVMRACKELGLRTVAIYSEADRHAPHVAYADAAYLVGPASAAQSYLNIERIIEVARESGAGAVHPGYGFLAENPSFARAVTLAGLVFIGPPAEVMERMGGKVAARREARAAGVPVVPGTMYPVGTLEELRACALEYGYPIAIKAVAGGGGRGFRVVFEESELRQAFESARREAEIGFGNADVYVEKYLTNPRHIEIQVLADTYGNVLHLGERECSIQRRHQKLIEESPSPVITPDMRKRMGEAAVRLAKQVGYVSAGTLEFIYQDGEFYFLEMNTRIQVEHTVTEMVTGVDLVKAQIRIAQGERLWLTQDDIVIRGHAIECRINAEDPANNFRPSLGTLVEYSEPYGFGVRVDSGVHKGYTIPQHYDSLIAKLICWGDDRAEAIARMRRALADYRIVGVAHTIPFHLATMAHPVFQEGKATINFIPHHLADQLSTLSQGPISTVSVGSVVSGPARIFEVEVNGRLFTVRVAETETRSERTERRIRQDRAAHRALHPVADGVASSLQGIVSAVLASPGQEVEAGQVVFVIEAMKMENEVRAPRKGVIGEVRVQVGQTVEPGTVLATYRAAGELAAS
ncbi:MAG: acetyl-CoA carboxylase biotin carboxylase subunit [Roseiflexus sp.]|mgnify:FL=1|jgi:acetyl-CoA/propionyl-CoA carboxylase biotin carboxyl carrier protein|uniref:acetyl-CoA carboxylase biotin carboxylase subunit n=1 Tax=Roseiflexus sp. TaxID=2562120 RepID=UPI001B09618D|nr:acetyl-CoA carboxylase biotin carboxylase subunit [Roseiflexus sp.]MBO9343627.1 acetyl-CoA carboxylase biotin carboxylase subunit [Roseiflexus sp.]MCL6538996.1 acetyl-CoA carboxylase biotin carboxylase subunit [Roseiflexus sp.]